VDEREGCLVDRFDDEGMTDKRRREATNTHTTEEIGEEREWETTELLALLDIGHCLVWPALGLGLVLILGSARVCFGLCKYIWPSQF
jgi:hypothetical protein